MPLKLLVDSRSVPLSAAVCSGRSHGQYHRRQRACSRHRAAPPNAPASAPENESLDAELHPVPYRGHAEQPPQMRVEGLEQEHWEAHFRTLLPGERKSLRRYIKVVHQINALRDEVARLSDEEMAAKTGELRQRLLDWERAAGAGGGASSSGSSSIKGRVPWPFRRGKQREELLGGMPQDVVVEAFALVKEAAHRVLGMRHYDVQLIGGLVLHDGKVAEMKTGEGKTLVATIPVFLNALTGRGVHVLTVNSYLARRDAAWIGKVFTFLGLSVGVVTDTSTTSEKIEALGRDITYTTARDLAFTYLYDNTATLPSLVSIRRPLHYAVVDEVDSILIDEAVNPFIITGPVPGNATETEKYKVATEVIAGLKPKFLGSEADSWDETGWQQFQREQDALGDDGAHLTVRLKYHDAILTTRGMTEAVWRLVQRGFVVLATNDSGRLAVALKDPSPTAKSVAITSVDVLTRGNGSIRASRGRGMAPMETVQLQDKSDKALADELEKRGFTVLQGQPSQAQLRAAVPAALWGDGRAWGNFLTLCLRAHWCYTLDVHYLLRDKKVVLVDVPTGRERAKSVWQEGLHQAVEAKHDLAITAEYTNTSSISYQALFNYYSKLSGMTGTAATEIMELGESYSLDLIRVPPHRPSIRIDQPMRVFFFLEGKWSCMLGKIVDAQLSGQPVLIGTGSVEESERLESWLSTRLRRIPVCQDTRIQTLNASPNRARFEAQVIAQAGLPRAITVATNLAGRGTDILLGGNPKGLVLQLLENKLLGIMAADAPDLDSCFCSVPLAGLGDDFDSEASMRQNLETLLFDAFQEAKQQLALAIQEEGDAAAGKQQISAATGKRAAVPGTPAPWRRLGSKQTAADATTWLGGIVEDAEVQRAHLRLQGDWVLTDSLQDVLEVADSKIRQYHRDLADGTPKSNGAMATGQADRARTALLRFVLLQWIWFDRRCHFFGKVVKRAGGLRVLLTSVPDSQRSELQLRGRAGRQGDPGDTHLLVCMDDPIPRALVGTGPNNAQALFLRINRVDPSLLEEDRDMIPPELMVAEDKSIVTVNTIKGVIVSTEDFYRRGRHSVRDYDRIMEDYRSVLYRVRRRILVEGSSTRKAILYRAFQDTAAGLVARLVDASTPPAAWPLLLIMQHVHALVNSENELGQTIDFHGGAWDVAIKGSFAVPRINLHTADTAAALRAAFDAGRELPKPPLLPDMAAKQRDGVPSDAPEAKLDPDSISTVSIKLREQQQLFDLRRQLQEQEQAYAVAAAATAPLQLPGLGGSPIRTLSGRYAAAAQRLIVWLTEYLAVQHRNKQTLLTWWWLKKQAEADRLTTPVEAAAAIAVCERDTMLARLDALWADFLADASRVQSISTLRTFSQLDPEQEYRLETQALFARLLRDFKHLVTLDVFGGLTSTALLEASRPGLTEAEAADTSPAEAEAQSDATEAAVQAATAAAAATTAAALGATGGAGAAASELAVAAQKAAAAAAEAVEPFKRSLQRKPSAAVAEDYDADDLAALFDTPEVGKQLEEAEARLDSEISAALAEARLAAGVSAAAMETYVNTVGDAVQQLSDAVEGVRARLTQLEASPQDLALNSEAARQLFVGTMQDVTFLKGHYERAAKDASGPLTDAHKATVATDAAAEKLHAAMEARDVAAAEAAAGAVKKAAAAASNAAVLAGAFLMSGRARADTILRKLAVLERGDPDAVAAEWYASGGSVRPPKPQQQPAAAAASGGGSGSGSGSAGGRLFGRRRQAEDAGVQGAAGVPIPGLGGAMSLVLEGMQGVADEQEQQQQRQQQQDEEQQQQQRPASGDLPAEVLASLNGSGSRSPQADSSALIAAAASRGPPGGGDASWQDVNDAVFGSQSTDEALQELAAKRVQSPPPLPPHTAAAAQEGPDAPPTQAGSSQPDV